MSPTVFVVFAMIGIVASAIAIAFFILWCLGFLVLSGQIIGPKRKSYPQRIAALEEELVKAQAAQVYVWLEAENGPIFMQGDKANELCELVTAADVARWLRRTFVRCDFTNEEGMQCSHQFGHKLPHSYAIDITGLTGADVRAKITNSIYKDLERGKAHVDKR